VANGTFVGISFLFLLINLTAYVLAAFCGGVERVAGAVHAVGDGSKKGYGEAAGKWMGLPMFVRGSIYCLLLALFVAWGHDVDLGSGNSFGVNLSKFGVGGLFSENVNDTTVAAGIKMSSAPLLGPAASQVI
jgi:hypothetical protein